MPIRIDGPYFFANPRGKLTGEKVKIAAKVTPRFKPAMAFKEAVR
jgi:nucleoid DNA-binding protein